MSQARPSSPTLWAQALGYSGLIPFVGLALAIWLLPAHQARVTSALLGYGATIASFLGAIHWGLTMRDPQGPNTSRLIWGVVPSLVAWLALMLPTLHGLLLIALLLWACFVVDRGVYTSSGLRAWLPMRLLLTLIASLSCIAGAMAMAMAMAHLSQ